jgi:methionyl-tRNA synthetase
MPRFAARLAEALGVPAPADAGWPDTVTLVEAGTRIDLAHRTFFGEPPAESDAELLPWLGELVRGALQLPDEEQVGDRTLMDLGMGSMQAVSLQYQILETMGIDIPVEDLLSERSVGSLAILIADLAGAEEVRV